MRRLFYFWTQNSYLDTLFPNSDSFISSRLSTPFVSLSVQIKPVNYLADEEKLGNNVSYFNFG